MEKNRGRIKNRIISGQMAQILVICALLVLVDLGISMVVIRDAKKQNFQYLDSMAEMYIEEQDQQFFRLGRQLLSILMGSGGTKQEIGACLEVLEESGDPLEQNVARAKLQSAFWEYTWDYGSDYRFFVWLEKNGAYVDLSSNSQKVPGMEAALTELLKSGTLDTYSAKAKWTCIRLPAGSFLLKVMCSQGRYLGCFLKADALLAPFEKINATQKGFQVLVDEEGRSVDFYEKDREKLIEHYLADGDTGIFSPYYVIEKKLERAPFTVLIFLDNHGIYGKLFRIQAALVLLAAAIMATLTFFMQYARRVEIALYENELGRSRIQMDYLQLQIKPHFYLNCLNFIYQMIDLGGYEEAKKMAAAASDYLRYLFQSSMDFVEIKSELSHVENYLKIQKMRYKDAFSYYIEQDEDTLGCRIPPLLIQTFVENSVRHSVNLDRSVEITILVCAEQLRGKGAVHISVSDTGEGFSEEMLRILNEGGTPAPEDGHRIGIANCLKRMRYFYQGKEKVGFYNNPAGGAVVDIYLPTEDAYEYSAGR